MIPARFIPLITKQVLRHRTRTFLTAGGVAVAMFLFCVVQGMQSGVAAATRATAGDDTLVVYRENRYCPFTSRLPEHYLERIAAVPHVASVVPVQIVVSNCGASLDVVTFRGVPVERFLPHAQKTLELLEGTLDAWERRSDAVLLGETLARRRGLTPGDSFDAAGITVHVAGIIRSREPQEQNVAYAHLDFLQRAAGRASGGGGGDKFVGVVTQFNVKVSEPERIDEVAAAIDDEFRSDPDPTSTRSEKAFVARAASDIIELVGFTRYLGLGCLAAVLALVGNAIVLSVQDRMKEHAVLQTLGFTGSLIGRLIIAEGLLLGLLGGVAGAAAAYLFMSFSLLSLSVEGLTMTVQTTPAVILVGLAISAALGVVAGLIPAVQASRREIAQCFRAV